MSIFAFAIGLVVAVPGDGRAPKIVDQLHSEYLKLFEDLTLTEEGKFGITRVETDAIKAHSNKSLRFRDTTFDFNVSIYGNHGKPLDPKHLEFRYSRNMNYFQERAGRTVPSGPKIGQAAAEMAAKLAKDGKRVVVTQMGDLYMEARPIKLTKKDCVACHSGCKLGTPVAVMVYQVAPRGTAVRGSGSKGLRR